MKKTLIALTAAASLGLAAAPATAQNGPGSAPLIGSLTAGQVVAGAAALLIIGTIVSNDNDSTSDTR